MSRSRLCSTLVAAFCVAAPAAAQAGTIGYDASNTLVIRSADGLENTATVTTQGDRISISDSSDSFTFPGDRCSQEETYFPVLCQVPASIRIETGDGKDSAVVFPGLPGIPVTLAGGDGPDELKQIGADTTVTMDGGTGDDTLISEDGADTLLGGPGQDKLTGGPGADALHGGDGDDLLRSGGDELAPDVIDGGAGTDTADDWGSTWGGPLTSVTQDGVANDGRPGEGDNVANIERLDVFVPLNAVGTEGDDVIENHSPADAGPSHLQGRGGNDVITAGSAVHTIDGGAGADRLEGGWGHDTITGGPGADTIFGDSTQGNCGGYGQSCRYPFGNDTIDARDGEADSVDCGVGQDKALVDAIDTVTACETVDKAGAPAAGPAATPRGGAGAKKAGARLAVNAVKLRKALRSGLTVRLAGLPKGKVVVRARHGKRTVASKRVTVGAKGTATVKLRFTKAARRTLGRKKAVRLSITAGAARAAVTLKR